MEHPTFIDVNSGPAIPFRDRIPYLRWYLLLPAFVLFATLGVQVIHPFGAPAAAKPPHLAQAIPTQLSGGWTVRDLPLGPNEFVAEAAQKILRTDEFVNREYRRGRTIFGIYAAYWGPGKMPIRLVASHTPDRCWTENGWKCQDMRFKQPTAIGERALQPAEWRRFEDPHGGIAYVLFWHLIEGRASDFGERFNAIPDPITWWKDAVQQAILGSPEQYFIRVTSNVPFDEIWQDPVVQQVLTGLAEIGLTTAAGPSHARASVVP